MSRTDNRPRKTSPLNLPSAFELFSTSYGVVKRQFDVFMILFSVGFLLALWDSIGRYVDEKEQGRDWGNLLANGVFGPDVDSGVFKSGGFMLLFMILYAISYLLLLIAIVRAAQGKQLQIRSLWNELTERWLWLKLIVANVLFGVAVVIGLLLLVIPGLILLWRLFLTPYILVDRKGSIEDAFRSSWRMTKGYAGAIYGVILVGLLISLINILPLIGGLLAFIGTSIYMVAPALRYEQLKKANQPT